MKKPTLDFTWNKSCKTNLYSQLIFCAWKYCSKMFGINWWYDSYYINKLWMKRFPAWFENLNVFNVNLNCTKNIEAKWSTCAAGCRVDHWGCKSCAQSAAYLKFSGSCIKTQKQFHLLDTCQFQCTLLLKERLPSKYDIVKLNAHWRWWRQLICQGDCYLNLLSIAGLTVQHSPLNHGW